MKTVVVDRNLTPHLCDMLNRRFAEPEVKVLTGEVVFDPAMTVCIAHIDVPGDRPVCEQDVLAIAALTCWTAASAELTMMTSGEKKKKGSRAFFHAIFDYAFNVCGLTRLNATIGIDNTKSIAGAELLGMNRVGRLDDQLGSGKHAYLYGITKSQWLCGQWASLSDEPINTEESTSRIVDGEITESTSNT
jgi:hypothetical protein